MNDCVNTVIRKRNQDILNRIMLNDAVDWTHSKILCKVFMDKSSMSERTFRNYCTNLVDEGVIEKRGELTGRYYKVVKK